MPFIPFLSRRSASLGDRGFLQVFSSDGIGSQIARQLILVAIVMPFALSWLVYQGQQLDGYDSRFGLTLIAGLLVIISLALIGRSAGILNQVEYDRKRSSDRLRSTEERLQLAQFGGDIATWEWDAQTGKTFWTEQCYPLFGVPQNDPAFFDIWIASIHPDDLQSAQNAIQHCLTTGSVEIEYRIYHPERGLRWIFSRAGLASDNPTLMRGVSFDFTDRKQTETEVQRLNRELDQRVNELQTILDAVPVGITIADDPACQFIRANSFAQSMLAVSSDANVSATGAQAETLPFRQLRNGKEIPGEELPMQWAVAQGVEVRDVEIQMVRSDGVSFDWLVNAVPLFNEQGAVRGCVAAFMDVTALKQAEIAFQQKAQEAEAGQQKLDALMNYIPEGITIADAPDVTIQRVSRFGQALTGRPAETILGIPAEEHAQAWDIYYPDGITPADHKVLPLTRAVQQGETVLDEEWVLRQPNGRKIVVLCNAGPIYDRDGEITGGIIAWRDISDRKQVQLNQQFLLDLDYRLRQLDTVTDMTTEATRRLGEYLEVSHCHFWEVDEPADLFTIHQDWARDGASITGTYRFSDFVLPDLQTAYRAGNVVAVADVNCDPLTATYAENFTAFGVQAFAGAPCQFGGRWMGGLSINSATPRHWRADELSLLQEITTRIWSLIEQTRAMQALREQEEQTRLATEAADLGMWFWNISQNELVWTDRCKAMFGFAPTVEMTYEIFLNALHPDDRDRTHAAVTRALEEKVEYDIEYRSLWSDGSLYWIAAKGRGFYDAAGQPIRMMGTAQNITERKQAELALKEQTELLIRADRLKDEFLAALSHELRTPLNPILVWTKMMKGQRLTPAKTAEALDIIDRNVRQQISLVNDLLDMSRVIQGKLNLEFHPVDLVLTLNNAIATVHFAAQAKGITIELHGLPSLITMGNSDRLQQVFWNLLSNAIKFTPENGCIKADLSMITNGNANRNAQICITDNGIGIAPEFLPHVFDHFRQADGSTTRKYGGLGLGLSIVRHLVDLHGGTVIVESAGVNQGTTFTVKLPIRTEG
jgi:PAS domain S-box-containing protein